MPESLSDLTSWPVGSAGAAVVTTGGVVETAGDLDAAFPWASVTKVLTAMAAWVALEEGTVELDEPAGPPGSTVRHLLAHASGLGPDGGRLAEVGARRIYSNAGIELVADLVSSAAAMPFGQYLREAVLEPLGMGGTRLEGSPASGATGPARDLAVLAAELLAPRLVDRTTWATATAVVFPGLSGVLPGFGRQAANDWGLGVEVRGHKSPHWTPAAASPRTFGHFGQAGGFVWVDPEVGVACLALSDRAFGPWAVEAWPRLGDAVLTAWGLPRPVDGGTTSP